MIINKHIKKKKKKGCFHTHAWQESQSGLDTNMKTFDKILSHCFGKDRC